MGVSRQLRPPNRLAPFVNTADGISLADAIARAEENVARLRPGGVVYVDQLLDSLGERAAAGATQADIERLYRTANELAGVAGSYGLPALGRAAYSLCGLLDAMDAQSWNAAAVQVHLAALRLLRTEDSGAVSPDAASMVLKGLDRVARRVAKPAAPIADANLAGSKP